MTNILTPVKKEQSNGSFTENQNVINHKQLAKHLEKAAKHHYRADKYLKAGKSEKANECILKARRHQNLASENQKEVSKQQALDNKNLMM